MIYAFGSVVYPAVATIKSSKCPPDEQGRVLGALNGIQVIPPIGAEALDRRGPVGACRPFLGPGFRLAARWNRLGETVKTRKKRGKTG